MSDDLKKRGRADRVRVNVHEEHELRYWTRRLKCSRDKLREAVAEVGPMVKDVAKYLGKLHLVLEPGG
jgi:hypothetical protein